MKNSNFEGKKLFVLDMDGTFYLDSTLIDGALEFLDSAVEKGYDFLFFTNNSSKSLDDYEKKLKKLQVPATRDKIFSSGDVTISFLNSERKNKKVYVIGTMSLVKGFENSGIELDDQHPDIVVLGFDTSLTYEKIEKGCRFIRNGAEFIATHPDANCPTENGLVPDTGSMIEMFKTSTGISPVIMGKPFHYTVEAIEKKTGYMKHEIICVGDRLNTDIALGVNHGMTSVLVMTGATTEEILSLSAIQPTMVLPSIKDLIKII
ncbi:MAG: HAD-IIA family hydrolase [Clostridia bacterium]|nr:HAD-IIA family hydrolase [Clostridia bacterium]